MMQKRLLIDTLKAKPAPSRHPNTIGKYEVILDRSKCTACGMCAEICHRYIGSAEIDYEAFKKPNGFLRLVNRKSSCIGLDCQICMKECKTNALTVQLNPQYVALGDKRWTADLISSTWVQAETGRPSNECEFRVGNSGGGFDRIRFAFELDNEGPRDDDVLEGVLVQVIGVHALRPPVPAISVFKGYHRLQGQVLHCSGHPCYYQVRLTI